MKFLDELYIFTLRLGGGEYRANSKMQQGRNIGRCVLFASKNVEDAVFIDKCLTEELFFC